MIIFIAIVLLIATLVSGYINLRSSEPLLTYKRKEFNRVVVSGLVTYFLVLATLVLLIISVL